MAVHYPSPELVACGWAKTIGGDVDPTKVATSLPGDTSVWESTGFVQVTVLSGNANLDVPVLEPVVAFDCWAVAPNSGKAPWGQAASLAGAIQWATYRRTRFELAMPTSYYPARLMSVFTVDGPRRIPSDSAGFARVRVAVGMAWTVTAEVSA